MFKSLFATFLVLVLTLPVWAQPDLPVLSEPTEATVHFSAPPATGPEIRSVQLSPDGRLLIAQVAIAQPNAERLALLPTISRLVAWDVNSGRIQWSIDEKHSIFWHYQFSPDGSKLVQQRSQIVVNKTGYHFGSASVIVRDSSTGEPLRVWEQEAKKLIFRVELSPDGKLVVASVSTPGEPPATLKAWDVATGGLVFRNDKNFVPYSLAFTDDGKFMLTHQRREQVNQLVFWSLPGFEEVRSVAYESALSWPMAVSPDNKSLVGTYKDSVTFQDADLSIIDLESGRQICQFRPEAEEFSLDGLAFSGDGETVIGSGAYTKQPPANENPAAPLETYTALWLWNSRTGALQRTLQEKKPEQLRAGLKFQPKLSSDGKHFIAFKGNKVQLRSIENGQVVREFEVPPQP